ncbi:MAG: hypothetical protein M3365_11505, partial [Gemmatimonadota bacterium]|nr:hypothetical protein [Gemmatimonadota bacterium]
LQVEQRFGWPSLRGNYLHTLFPDVFGVSPTPAHVLRSARSPYAMALWHRAEVEGPLNYKIAKRLVEHVVFRDAADENPDWRERVASAHLRRSAEHVLDEDYVLNGLDLRSGSSTIRLRVPAHPQREAVRELPEGFVRAFAAYQSPWASSVEWLRHLSPEARADLVDAAAAAIATSHLQAEIERQEVAGDPEAHFRQTDRLLTAPEGLWRARFEAIAKQAADLVAASGENADERVLGLAAALRHGERVIFVHGGTPNDTKQRAIEGFNTPLYPEVLIATGVLAEGIDLHRACRRVIHHDLPWNPAKLEQRTGRVDRIGSLSARLQQEHGDVPESAVDIGLPYVAGTYDETIFRRVLARRREFRCLLGNRPEWDKDELDAVGAEPICEAMVMGLQTHLGPTTVAAGPRRS